MPSTTLLDYLTEPNPVLNNDNSLEGPPTKVEDFENLRISDWEDFNYNNLIYCYGDILIAQQRTLPEISPQLTPLECQIFNEDSLDHLLTRGVVPQVNQSLSMAWRQCHSEHPHLIIEMTRGGRARGIINDSTAPGSSQTSANENFDNSKSFPDWAGVRSILVPYSGQNRCPGDTKLSTKWKSYENTDKIFYKWPFAQIVKYCGDDWNTRYGYLITQKELVVMRISREMIPSGIAKTRSRRNVPDQVFQATRETSPPLASSSSRAAESPERALHVRNHSVASSQGAMLRSSSRDRRESVTASLKSMSMSDSNDHAMGDASAAYSEQETSSDNVHSSQSYRDDGMGGEYQPTEIKSIPWDNAGQGVLTVKLGLWWIHMMAAAPGCNIRIGHTYIPVDKWIHQKNGVYRHISTGFTTRKRPADESRIVREQETEGPSTLSRPHESFGLSSSSSLSSPPPDQESSDASDEIIDHPKASGKQRKR